MRRVSATALALNETSVPQRQVDQRPEGVVAVGAAGEVLRDHRPDPIPVEVSPDHLGTVEELDHVLPELLPEPLLEREAVPLLAPGEDPRREDAAEGAAIDRARPEAGELQARRDRRGQPDQMVVEEG